MGKTLEERQKEWDEKYDSPNSESAKQRPVRPSKENDDKEELIKNTVRDQLKKRPRTYEEEIFTSSQEDSGRLVHSLSYILQNDIDLQIKRYLGDRSSKLLSLTKESPYGIAHFDRVVSLRDLYIRLSHILEEGVKEIMKAEKELYDKRKYSFSPGSRPDFFGERY